MDNPQLVINMTSLEISELARHEAVIERGLNTFVEVGAALLAIRGKKLYRDKYETFEYYCRERWGWARNYANKLIRAAEVVENLGTIVPILPATETQARPLASLPPETQREVWERAVETVPDGKMTAAHVQAVVDEIRKQAAEAEGDTDLPTALDFLEENWDASNLRFKPDTQLAYCKYCHETHSDWELSSDHADPMCWECLRCHHFSADDYLQIEIEPAKLAVHFSSESPEWNTPPIIIERALQVLGTIDLDPCADSKDNPNIPAANHYTIDDDGLSKSWAGKVYMNPPYGREIDAWVEKLCREHEAGRTEEAIALVPARTDTKWWFKLRDYPVCFIYGRLKFGNAEKSAPFPSAVFYLGSDIDHFYYAFYDIGDIWQKIEPGMFGED